MPSTVKATSKVIRPQFRMISPSPFPTSPQLRLVHAFHAEPPAGLMYYCPTRGERKDTVGDGEAHRQGTDDVLELGLAITCRFGHNEPYCACAGGRAV